MTAPPTADDGSSRRREILRQALTIGAVTGAYGISFGAVAVAAGLTVAQTAALSLLMFTGGSQFAMVGTIAGGASAWAGAATAALLGVRNAFYGLELKPVLGASGLRRVGAAHLVIDESAAMGAVPGSPAERRLGFWATGLAVFVGWNVMTVVGAVGASALDDPGVLGLDVAGPAAFVALLAPRLIDRGRWTVALVAALAAVASAPFAPAGVPVLFAALVAVVAGWRGPAGAPEASESDAREVEP